MTEGKRGLGGNAQIDWSFFVKGLPSVFQAPCFFHREWLHISGKEQVCRRSTQDARQCIDEYVPPRDESGNLILISLNLRDIHHTVNVVITANIANIVSITNIPIAQS